MMIVILLVWPFPLLQLIILHVYLLCIACAVGFVQVLLWLSFLRSNVLMLHLLLWLLLYSVVPSCHYSSASVVAAVDTNASAINHVATIVAATSAVHCYCLSQCMCCYFAHAVAMAHMILQQLPVMQ